MKLIRNIFVILMLISGGGVWGQLSLDINPITQVLVGGGFQVSGRIVHDANSSNITAGTPIQLDIGIQDPSGNSIMTNPTINIVAGFSGGRVENFSQAFQMPWSEDDKWSASALWRAVVQVSGGGSPQGNITFPLIIPDLAVSVNSPTIATPGSYIDLQGSITNISVAASEPQRFFRVQASIVGTSITETIIFPDPASFPANSPWPVVANADLNFTIPNFFIPNTLTGPIQINVEVDPANPEIIPESNQNNNTFNHTIILNVGTAAIATTVFFDAVGTYQGLDPIQFKVVARNSGTDSVVSSDNFILTIALSQDNTFNNDDFILREIDVGGGSNALGLGLLPNETVSVDWIQLLPDNFEGDFYVLVSLNGATAPLFSSSTPEISLRSENSVDISNITNAQTNRSGRPSTDLDGNFVAFESFQDGQMQIFVQNIQTGQTVRVSNGYDGSNPDGSSYAPVLSSDGRYLAFHSLASNLVPVDNNNHSDVFLYEVSLFNRVTGNDTSKLSKISNSYAGGDANEGSFYPSIDSTGSHIVFESEATNLTSAGNLTGGRQIYLFDQNSSTASGVIQQITAGNGDSFDSSISGDGSRVVFTTHATNLITTEADLNNNSDIILWENGNLYFAGRSESGVLPLAGDSKEPVISSDGSTIAFQSSATNMVTGKGISYIEIIDGGLGYTSNAKAQISDADGSGASVSFAVNAYGEITQFVIDAPGFEYADANLSITPDPTAPAPTRLVNAKPRLVNPMGDIFKISVDSVKNGTGSTRVSESQKLNGLSMSETGGNQRSREPVISADGSLIAYSTQANNLLDLNLTSTSQKTFPNLSFRPASAQAVLHGGIGKIIVSNPGLGYPSAGTFLIQDLSGNGSGAVATYQIDSLGRIGSITIQNSGSGYDLSQTIISIQNPGTGTGFTVGQILFPAIIGTGTSRQGGGSLHRVEMLDPGIGYPQNLHNAMQTPTIIVDGDGVDTDGDGQADSRINSDLIHFGQNGEIYLEQQFEISINNLPSLSSTTLQISDYSRLANGNSPVVISFANSQFPPPLAVSTFDNDASAIRDRLITMINNQWSNPADLKAGPQIDNNLTGGISFTLKALSGRVVSNNPSALSVKQSSNMLIQGSAFTRATAQITPAPVIHGFSEIASGMNTATASNGRPIFQFQEDLITDDIYLHNSLTSRNERISISKFGFPTNYRINTNMPSHRFPSLSGDGRYIFFSSDAGGLGGLIFGNSNQLSIPATDNNRRDIFLRDMKSRVLPQSKATISLQLDIFEETNYTIPQGQQMPVILDVHLEQGYVERAYLYADNQLVTSVGTGNPGSNISQMILPWTTNREGYSKLYVVVEDNFGNEFLSPAFDVKTVAANKEIMRGDLLLNPSVLGAYEIMIIQRTGPPPNPIIGPFTEGQIDVFKVTADPQGSSFNDAFFASDSILNFKPLDDLYPSRANVTRGSTLNGSVDFTSSTGKQSDLSKVIFFLNGKKLFTDFTSPYSVNFTPPGFAENNSTVLKSWVLTAQAYPLSGTPVMVQRFGGVDHEVIFPNIKLKLVDEGEFSNNIVYENQSIRLYASVTGKSDTLAILRDHHFVVNGKPLASAPPIPTINANGETTQVDFFATLNPDFAKFANPDGSVEIIVLGELNIYNNYTPVYKSNPINLTIAPPIPWVDQTSSALAIYSDFSDNNLTFDQLELFQNFENSSNTPLADWTNYLVALADFQDRIDLQAAHHITMGAWHDTYVNYSTDLDMNVPSESNSSILWLKSYINKLLSSTVYTSKYGMVPYLVGSASMSKIYNFGKNRRVFAEQCLGNKFSYSPSFLQMNQASMKMLDFWTQFEPNYWEVGSSSDLTGQTDSPPRRDSQTGNQYGAGECAVDLIYRLAVEEKINGFPYISYTEDYRESYYKIGSIMVSLWKEGAYPIDHEFIQIMQTKTQKEMIEKILSDPRYTSKFNIIWSESDEVENAPNWKSESWFGYFMDSNFPWVYHEDLGWIYIAGVSPTQFWFYSVKLGWLWTGSTHYPALYSSTDKGWIYFDKLKTAYYSYVTQSWKSF